MRQLLYPTNLSFASVKAAAQYHWPSILATAGIPEKHLKKKHGSCPVCGGEDRFRFDDKNGHGTFYCNGCGSGDGFRLIQLFRRCTPRESLRIVADIWGSKPITQLPQRKCNPVSDPQSNKKLIECKRQLLYKTWNEADEIIE